MPSADLKNFHAATRDAKKILVVDLGFLGDTVHLVPALWEIKRHHPSAALHVASAPVGVEVLRLAPCVDRAWPVVLDPAKRTFGQQWSLIRGLRREKFDVAFNFSGADRATILTALSGARRRVGHTTGRRHFWNAWLIQDWAPRQDPHLTVYEQRRGLLADCGFTLQPPQFDLRVDAATERWAESVVPQGAIHVSVNASKPLKEWPLEHYAETLKLIWQSQPNLPVVASAGAKERERERLRQFQTAVNDPRLRLLLDNLSIAQLVAVLKRCRLHIGPDSGVIHVAMASGVPTISFIRAQGEYKAWVPPGPNHLSLEVSCECIEGRHAPCEPSSRAACLARVTPAQVVEMVCGRLKL